MYLSGQNLRHLRLPFIIFPFAVGVVSREICCAVEIPPGVCGVRLKLTLKHETVQPLEIHPLSHATTNVLKRYGPTTRSESNGSTPLAAVHVSYTHRKCE